MKTLLFSLLLSTAAFAQNDKSGVYLTFDDYLNNKLSYEINCATEKHTIRLNEFLNESYITVVHNGVSTKLNKVNIYGVVSCTEPLARFQNNEHFHFAEKGGVWIFYKEVSVSEGKGSKMERRYYFSKKGDGKLMELTAENLKAAFPENHKLHDMIDANSANNINQYDTFHKMFRVNHFLKECSM